MIAHDDAFKFLKTIRSSPAFWQQKQKELMSMIRQLGCPTFFLTLSAAETKWPELLRILKEILDDVKLSTDGALELQWNERAELIRRDPVTCARYFDHRSKELFRVLRSEVCPLGKLTDFYMRIEFQQRGSPHVHSLLWIENAPKYGISPLNEVIEFIDRTITCKLPNTDSLLSDGEIDLQRHKHTHTCYKRKSFRRCRFGIPYPPMVQTQILEPLDFNANTASKEEIAQNKSLKETAIEIYTLIDNFDKGDTDLNIISIEDFLQNLSLTHEEYIIALRSCLKRPTVFLQRNMNELRINAHNETVLYLWKANMDLQYILDPYACVVYVVSYIGKAQRGMSKLLKDALLHYKAGDTTIKERLRGIANKFQNCSEVSAQEVSYHLLSLPLSKCSRANVYINTGPADKRVRILKSKPILQGMPHDSEAILQPGLIEHYIQRPDQLENVCLAEFAAMYDFQSNTKILKINPEFEDGNSDQEDIPLLDNPSLFPLKDSGYMRLRRKPKVIRFRRYNIIQDEVNFYREQLMLYLPWRNEYIDSDNIDFRCVYETNVDLIKLNRSCYESSDQASIDEAINVLEDVDPDQLNFDGVAIEETMQNEGIEVVEDTDYLMDNPGDHVWSVDATTNSSVGGFFNVPNRMSEDEFLAMCRRLNLIQRRIFLHTLHCFKTNKQLPMYLYIGGGAGVGKSTVIRALYEGLVRYFNSLPSTNPDAIKVLLAAPTGKAAHNIHGMTLHSAFALPVMEFGGEIPNLSSDVLNTLRSKLLCLKLIIIDEISMVGSKILSQVNSRLKAILDTSLDFGGVSIICVGDFHQLRPVKDSYVFQIPNSGTESYDLLVGPYLWEKFSFVELTEIMRQKDDQKFAVALNNFANCTLTEEDNGLFLSRQFGKESLNNLPPKAIHLFSTNASVNAHNESVLNVLTTEGCKFTAIDSLAGDTGSEITDKFRDSLRQLKVSDTQGLPYELFLKISARYLMTINNDTSDGLVNGATGILQRIEYGTRKDTQARVPCILWIEFDDPTVGKEKRANSKARYLHDNTILKTWTPIGLETRRFQRGKGVSCYRIVRKQFPFIVAEALTNHKSQGDTYECVVVHIEPRLPRNALYTALSRAKTASGLFIVGNLKLTNKISENDPVFRELKRLKEHCSIIWSILLTSPTVYVQNIRSLNKHCADVICDPLILHSEILVLQETMTTLNDTFSIPGHFPISRVDGKARIPGSGTHIYSRNPSKCHSALAHTSCHNNGSTEILVVEISDPSIKHETVTLISVYKSPRVSLTNLISDLDMIMSKINLSLRSIIVGDFNIHPESHDGRVLFMYFASKNFYSAISGISTDYNTQLDHVFYRGFCPTVNFYESYFSDHKPMLITFSEGILHNDTHKLPKYCLSQNIVHYNSTKVHDISPDVIIDHVTIPPPVPAINMVRNNEHTFTDAMRRTLADSINLQHIPIRPTDFTGARVTSTPYYTKIRTYLKSRFNLMLIPVIGDGNCLFRTLSHIIFGDESEHHNVRGSLIQTFEHSPYVGALCGLQGYNTVTIQQHFNNMKRNYSWGTVNELIMLGILACINVSYINATDIDPSKWVITDVYDANTLGIPNDPIFGNKSLVVLFHSINFSGLSANHYDAIYKFQ